MTPVYCALPHRHRRRLTVVLVLGAPVMGAGLAAEAASGSASTPPRQTVTAALIECHLGLSKKSFSPGSVNEDTDPMSDHHDVDALIQSGPTGGSATVEGTSGSLTMFFRRWSTPSASSGRANRNPCPVSTFSDLSRSR